MNQIILIGNVANDPETATTQSGIARCTFRIGVQRAYKAQDGQRESDFFTVITWRGLAENCGKYLKKGTKCAVRGSVQNRSYQAQDGSKRYVTEVMAEEVQFLGSRQDAAQNGVGGAQSGQNQMQTPPPAFSSDNGFMVVDNDELPF